jgi:hypothetical protein
MQMNCFYCFFSMKGCAWFGALRQGRAAAWTKSKGIHLGVTPVDFILSCALQENPELLNIYLPATSTHLQVLLLAATASTRRRQLATAEKHLRRASTLLPYCRCLPSAAVQVALQLAQVLRLQAALKLPATDLVVARSAAAAAAAAASDAAAGVPSSTALKGTELQLQRLSEAAELAGRALQLAVSDAGSPPAVARSALLELAAAWLYSYRCAGRAQGANYGLLSKVAAALQAAHVTAGQLRVLCMTNHQLQTVSVGGLPAWLTEQLKGQEQLQISLQQQIGQAAAAAATAAGKPTPHRRKQQQLTLSAASAAAAAAMASAVPDSTLGRLAVCQYVRLLMAAYDGTAGLQQQQLAAAQVLQLHPAMRAACPKLASDCCWSEAPVVGAAAAGGGGAGTAAAAAAGTTPDAANLPLGEIYA